MRKHKKSKVFSNEAELAAALVEYHKEDGWDVFEEIAPKGGGRQRADIVAVKDGKIRVIECKMNLSWAVLEQGRKWIGHADEIFLGVPAMYRYWRVRGEVSLALRCATELLNIGVMEALSSVSADFEVHTSLPKAFPEVVPKHRKALEAMLIPEVQEYNAAAGTAGGTFWTPFKGTCKKLLDLVNDKGAVSVREAVDKIDHHYRTDSSARGAISNLAKRGVIPGVGFEKRGNKPYLTPGNNEQPQP